MRLSEGRIFQEDEEIVSTIVLEVNLPALDRNVQEIVSGMSVQLKWRLLEGVVGYETEAQKRKVGQITKGL